MVQINIGNFYKDEYGDIIRIDSIRPTGCKTEHIVKFTMVKSRFYHKDYDASFTTTSWYHSKLQLIDDKAVKVLYGAN